MKIEHINTRCSKLNDTVGITITRPDPTPQVNYPPFRLTNCDSAPECGLIKEVGIVPDWSLCPLYESRFWM
jgi:hypothetical protein